MILSFLVSASALLGAYIGIPGIAKTVLRRRSLARLARTGAVYLTFDDGPDPAITPQILDLLATFGARATFFAVGENIERYPEIARRIVADGHALGEHSYRHLHAWKTGPWMTLRDMLRGSRALDPFRPAHDPESFRPPYGKFNLASFAYTIAARKRVVFWDIDPRDYACGNAHDAFERVEPRLDSGRVVLLHDGRRAHGSPASVTAETLRAILEKGRKSGLRFERVDAFAEIQPAPAARSDGRADGGRTIAGGAAIDRELLSSDKRG